MIAGEAGRDALCGGAGADIIDGGEDRDTLSGGGGGGYPFWEVRSRRY